MTRRLAILSALACALAAGAGASPAHAAEGDVLFGTQWWNQSARDAKYQEFREVPRGAFLESFMLREWGGRNSVSLWGANAIRGDQSSRLAWANGVRWRLDLAYAQIPHLFSHEARWAWLQSQPGRFILPDSVQARNQAVPASYTARMADLLSTAPRVGLGFGTNVTKGRLRARPARGWQFEARSRVTKRSGLKPYGMSFGFSTALENPEPIDQRIIDADLIAGYQRDRLTLRASGGMSKFDNGIGELRVDNPRRITDVSGGDGTSVGQLDLYPDNRVVRGSLALAYRLASTTALAATVGLAQGKQNDDFLPFTINTALPQSNPDSLPAKSLDAKTMQLTGDVRLTSRPLPKLDGTLRFNYADYDNQTDELSFIGQAPYEASWQRFIDLHNHVFSSTRWVGGLDLDYAFAPRLQVGGIAEYRKRERTAREVEDDHETVLGGRLRLRPLDGLALKARYTRGDRQQDDFELEEYEGLTTRTAAGSTPGLFDSIAVLEQPGLRRYDVADRVQDRAGADVAYALGERVELSAGYEFLRNDFRPDTLLGLGEEKTHSVASAATVHWSERLDLTGGYGFNTTRTDQRSRSSGARMTFLPESLWTAQIEEEEVFVFAGLDWTPRTRLGFSADYQVSRSVSKFDLDNGLHNALDLPKSIYRRHDLLVETRWQWLAHTSLLGRWGWEQYDAKDWATTSVPLIFPVTGSASAIFLGDSSRSYRAHRLALLVHHTF